MAVGTHALAPARVAQWQSQTQRPQPLGVAVRQFGGSGGASGARRSPPNAVAIMRSVTRGGAALCISLWRSTAHQSHWQARVGVRTHSSAIETTSFFFFFFFFFLVFFSIFFFFFFFFNKDSFDLWMFDAFCAHCIGTRGTEWRRGGAIVASPLDWRFGVDGGATLARSLGAAPASQRHCSCATAATHCQRNTGFWGRTQRHLSLSATRRKVWRMASAFWRALGDSVYRKWWSSVRECVRRSGRVVCVGKK